MHPFLEINHHKFVRESISIKTSNETTKASEEIFIVPDHVQIRLIAITLDDILTASKSSPKHQLKSLNFMPTPHNFQKPAIKTPSTFSIQLKIQSLRYKLLCINV